MEQEIDVNKKRLIMNSPLFLPALAGAFAAAFAPSSFPAETASGYPSRPVRLIVPYTPGGGVDIIARIVASHYTRIFQQQFVVENRSGAGTVLGTELAARATPDGYTLLFATSAGLVINPLLSKLSYDPFKDFQPITLLVTSPQMMAVINSVPVKSVKDLIDYARKNPGKLNYASAGIGAPNHISTELFKHMTQTDMVHVPFKGFGPGITDMLGGQVQVMMNPVMGLTPYVKAGKVRALGVSTPQRLESWPDLPTIAEAGVPGYEYELWYSLVAPARTPMPIILKLNAEMVKFLADPDIRQKWASQGTEPRSSTPEELSRLMRNEFNKLGKVIRAANITAEH
jgi:tripartite-type tricarboxylate transporter receptor subunit TctC